MAWQDNLRPASFRGVPFKVESHDMEAGRRTVTHEFPLRDKPFTEDMGRRAKKFSVDAYVVGEDYFQQRDALIRACDEAGSAELVHPYLGTLKVVCTGLSLRETKSEGRMARFALSFIESGEADFPSDASDSVAQSAAASDAAEQSSTKSFGDLFSIDGLPDFTIADAQAILTNASNEMLSIASSVSGTGSSAFGYVSTVNTFTSSLTTLMRSPVLLAGDFFGLVGGLGSIFDSPRSAVGGLFNLFDFGSDQKPIPVTTVTRQSQQGNRNAINGLVRQSAVIEAARLAPSATYDTAEDAQGVRDTITAQLDSIMEDPATPDAVFEALQTVRTAVVQGVPPEAVSLPHLMTVTPFVTTPSLVIAYDLYEDATREAEIVSRNSIKYPGFVPGAEPLQVISNA